MKIAALEHAANITKIVLPAVLLAAKLQTKDRIPPRLSAISPRKQTLEFAASLVCSFNHEAMYKSDLCKEIGHAKNNT